MALSKDDYKRILEEVRENQRRLRECDYHEFEMVPFEEKLRGASVVVDGVKYSLEKKRCKNCRGEVNFTTASYYDLGKDHEKAKNLEAK